MPLKNGRRKRSSTSVKEDGNNSHSDSGHETDRKKKVRWEQTSNTMYEEVDCSDPDEDFRGLEKAMSPHFLVIAR